MRCTVAGWSAGERGGVKGGDPTSRAKSPEKLIELIPLCFGLVWESLFVVDELGAKKQGK